MRRPLAGGVVGPVAFVAAWAWLGARARADGYSPIADPISRLAAVGAPTHTAMTAGMLTYAAAVATGIGAVRAAAGAPMAAALAVNALGTVAVAATPLDSSLGGTPHAAAATVSYVSLAALPLLAARPLAGHGRTKAATASVAAGAACAACLVASTTATSATGLFQRTGLTIGHLWLVAGTIALARHRRAAVS